MSSPARRSKGMINKDTGFGTNAAEHGGRFINKDGSFNLTKTGWSARSIRSPYSIMLNVSRGQFIAIVLTYYLVVNLLYTGIYLLIGMDQLSGYVTTEYWARVREIFYFSAETFTTVGYGRVNPIGDAANIVSSIESLSGILSAALATGLIYGRFSKPKSYVAFSEQALISPYNGGRGLMFRLVPYKRNHHLTDVEIKVNMAITVKENGKDVFHYYSLPLERSRVDTLTMNWTVVHPIDTDSPLLNMDDRQLAKSDAEVYVAIRAFDDIFSNTVLSRTSYTFDEIVYGAKFRPMFRESEDGKTTIVELDKLNHFDRVELPPLTSESS